MRPSATCPVTKPQIQRRVSPTPAPPNMLCLPVQTAIIVLACLSLAAAAYQCASTILLPSILSPISCAIDAVFVSTHVVLCMGILYFAKRKWKGWYQVCAVTKLVHCLAVVFVFLIAVVAEAVVQGRGKQVLRQPLVAGEMCVLVVDGVVSGMLCYCGTRIVAGKSRKRLAAQVGCAV